MLCWLDVELKINTLPSNEPAGSLQIFSSLLTDVDQECKSRNSNDSGQELKADNIQSCVSAGF